MTTQQQFKFEERARNVGAWVAVLAVLVVIALLLVSAGATAGEWLDAPAKNIRATRRAR